MLKLNLTTSIVVSLFLLAFFIRWYKLPQYLFFGFEQGRDAQIIKNIYQLKDFILVGPPTSIGGVFHGPFYYYMMALPLRLGGGNPLVAAFFLVLLGAVAPPLIFLLTKDILKSMVFGLLAGVFLALSFEYILYARWLSNVSAAYTFVALSFYSLWKYIEEGKSYHFLLFCFFSSIAILFQMMLAAQFIFVVMILFITKIYKLPDRKTFTLSLTIILVLFSPLILFDVRNQHISLNSIVNFISGFGSGDINLISAMKIFFIQSRIHFANSLVNIDNNFIQLIVLLVLILGTILYLKKTGNKRVVIFLYTWSFMTIPVILLGPGNPQYYLGSGLGWIIILSLSLKSFWQTRSHFKTPSVILSEAKDLIRFFGLRPQNDSFEIGFNKLILIHLLIFILVIYGWIKTLSNLSENKNIFFVTIQDDLNLADQRKVLDFIHHDSAGEPYRLEAFTIPSLHPEGWLYLHNYYYPKDLTSKNGKLIYVVIEKNVYPIWEEKWIGDLGDTRLNLEKTFGLLRVQKRIIL